MSGSSQAMNELPGVPSLQSSHRRTSPRFLSWTCFPSISHASYLKLLQLEQRYEALSLSSGCESVRLSGSSYSAVHAVRISFT